ncbi:MAG: type II toxin-antitoxin system prevent-host-death family antitoxin, partial [Actinomycetota bacterium]|nr:type II toxin-antitoxin system prevent-host-death family antitoxin [Actinomycetota bacterium]
MTSHRRSDEVGVRELHAKLSSYVDAVSDGAEIVVTKRGRRVARLIAISDDDPLERMIREGRATPPSSAA